MKKDMLRLISDDSKCGEPLNKFSLNEMFGINQSLPAEPVISNSLANLRQSSSKSRIKFGVSFGEISEFKLGNTVLMPANTVE
jgi:hypothetical protein